MIRYLERRLIDLRPERHCAWADLKDLPPLRALARAKSRSGRMPRNLKLPHGTPVTEWLHVQTAEA